MGASVGGAQSGRRKSLDAEVNLVPFIDLLSMCICFLLVTAVWIQIGSLQVKQSHGSEAAALSRQASEMDIEFHSPQLVEISIKQNGKSIRRVSVADPAAQELLSKLDARVRELAASGRFEAAMLTPVHGVPYGQMVAVMDILRRNKITNLGVVPVRDSQP